MKCVVVSGISVCAAVHQTQTLFPYLRRDVFSKQAQNTQNFRITLLLSLMWVLFRQQFFPFKFSLVPSFVTSTPVLQRVSLPFLDCCLIFSQNI